MRPPPSPPPPTAHPSRPPSLSPSLLGCDKRTVGVAIDRRRRRHRLTCGSKAGHPARFFFCRVRPPSSGLNPPTQPRTTMGHLLPQNGATATPAALTRDYRRPALEARSQRYFGSTHIETVAGIPIFSRERWE